jgi:hypothetical protein
MSSRGLPATFAAACRAADREQRKQPHDAHIERLRELMDDSVTLERAWHETNHPWRGEGRVAVSVVDALVFGLRDGIDALKDRSNQRRLGELSDAQMGEVAARVQRFMPHIAPAWQPADVQALLSLWSRLR